MQESNWNCQSDFKLLISPCSKSENRAPLTQAQIWQLKNSSLPLRLNTYGEWLDLLTEDICKDVMSMNICVLLTSLSFLTLGRV